MARLTETLINENKIEKAKDVINIAIENMPVDNFGYYAFVEPFVDGYFKVGETEKARKLFQKLKNIYQERLDYYANLPFEEQRMFLDEIIPDLEAYSRNIDILITNQDKDTAEKETLVFNEYIAKFERFYQNDPMEKIQAPSSDPDLMDSTIMEIIPDQELDSIVIPE